MRVSALRMAISSRIVAGVVLMATASLLVACDGLVKKIPDACSVSVAPRDITIPVNGSTSIVGTAFDCKGNSIAKRPVTFSSTNNSIATVNASGQVVGISIGTTKVSATASGKSADVNVTVTPERVATVTVTPTTITLRKTNVRQFSSVAKNALGNVIDGLSFQWASSNSSIASVDNTGKVTALTTGTVNITATSDGQTGTSQVTVTEVPIGSCTLAPASQKILVNLQGVITASLKDTAGNALSSLGRGLSWSSDNEVVATVSNTGTVTGRKAGTAKISATSTENTSVTCGPVTAEIANPNIKFAVIAPVGAQLRLGVPRQYSVTLFDSTNTVISNVGRNISWRSVTPAVVTVTGSGIATGVSLGAGRLAVDAEGIVDTVPLTVSKIPVASVTVSPLSSSVAQGGTRQFTPTVTDSAGNIVNDRVIEWISSDVNKATVSTSGLATAIGAGTISISANTEGKSGSAQLIITLATVDTIQVVSQTFTLAKGTTSPFSITLRDILGNQLRNRSVQVTSDQPSIATGVADGAATQVTVTGVTVGTATLTIQAVDSNGANQGKASKVTVTVTAAPPL